jgi:hypothetical protein
MAIGEYFVVDWWLLITIVLMAIDEYFIVDIGGY